MSTTAAQPVLDWDCGWDVPADDMVWDDVPHPAGDGSRPARVASPVDELIGLLASADQIMATAIRVLRACRCTGVAERQSGLPIERLVSLATGRTGTDVRFLSRAERTLVHLPTVDAAFAAGWLSWSQVRGIITATSGLRVAQLAEFDRELGAEIGQGEPDRIVQRAFGWAEVIAADDAEVQPEDDPGDRKSFRVQPDLFGGAAYYGYDRIDAVSAIFEAANAAADPPAKPDEVRVDADGTPVPADLLPATARQAQLAEGLRRVADAYLAGTQPPSTQPSHNPDSDTAVTPTGHDTDSTRSSGGSTPDEFSDTAQNAASAASTSTSPARSPSHNSSVGRGQPAGRARTAITVIIDHTDLLGATGRALIRWNGGPIRLSRLTTDRLLCDPQLAALITDDGRPVAVGDATAPISIRHYRTLYAIDRGCRMPGCNAPAQHCDAHHLVPREHGGATTTDNLALMCRDCHSRIHKRRLDVRLDRHSRAVTLTTPDGHTYTSLPA